MVKPASEISPLARASDGSTGSQPLSPTRCLCSVLGDRSLSAAMLHEHLPPAELQDAAELSQRALEEASPAPCP
ncbi:hypothetical protein CIT26_02095 [Mesorhizobium temperatum]|uniref:Uncharacterized protein n=1 Tax=Mesorhizobium temperatum TaxID=241416 RepID=A0A271LXE5_9HYPH|nr:hypothetical protein CIT26_02095 [Mesorhizobium temperatum]